MRDPYICFLLQERDTFPSGASVLDVEANIVANIALSRNEWDRCDPKFYGNLYKISACKINELDAKFKEKSSFTSDEIIPVGTLEFCNKVASLQKAPQINAINIPDDLNKFNFLFRRTAILQTIAELKDFCSMPCIIKPADYPHRFETVEVDGADSPAYVWNYLNKQGGPYFVSEVIKDTILSEWRIFFYNGKIIDCRPYVVSEWSAPNKDRVEDMLSSWTHGIPPAGTLDVAVVQDNIGTVFTTLIEAHQLISCGLYGFEGSELLQMLIKTWRWHKTRENQ